MASQIELDLLEDAAFRVQRCHRQESNDQLLQLQNERATFLAKCEKLAQQVIPLLASSDTTPPLDKAYQLLEYVVSMLQSELLKKQHDQATEVDSLMTN